jgi:hypothetical protein
MTQTQKLGAVESRLIYSLYFEISHTQSDFIHGDLIFVGNEVFKSFAMIDDCNES